MSGAPAGGGRLIAGRYRLIERIGSGGMGTVWRAYDDVLRVDVALKEIRVPADLAEDERVQQVDTAMREARNAARLRGNPHVVTVHDAVEHDGLPWIVMDLVRASTLGEAVGRDGPLPPVHAARIGLAVLDALVAGQRLGVLHRDVKPSNILLAEDGQVRLTDFGIATHASDPTLTGGIGSGGTPAYMAPERLLGGPATLAADLFALGATLYFAVEGVSPFQRDTLPGSIGAVLHVDPPPSTRAGRLWPAIAGMIIKNPGSRLRADGALDRLTAAATAEADPGPRPGLHPPFPPPPFPPPPLPGSPPPYLAAAGPPPPRYGPPDQARPTAPLAAPVRPVAPAPPAPPAPPVPPAPPSAPPAPPIRPAPGSRRTAGDHEPVSLRGFPGPAPAFGGGARPGLAPAAPSARFRWVRSRPLLAGLVIGALVLLGGLGLGLHLAFGGEHAASADPRTPVASGTPVAPGALPPGLVGTWNGTVTQSFVQFPVELVLRGGPIGGVIGTSAYPRDGCAGDLVLAEVTGPKVRLTERLTSQSPLCIAASEVDLELSGDGTLVYSYPATLISSPGRATLRRLTASGQPGS